MGAKRTEFSRSRGLVWEFLASETLGLGANTKPNNNIGKQHTCHFLCEWSGELLLMFGKWEMLTCKLGWQSP